MKLNHIYMLPAVVEPHSSQIFCDQAVDGISALFLALKRRPVIRYQRTSDIAKRIAQESAVSIIKTCAHVKIKYLYPPCFLGFNLVMIFTLPLEDINLG